MLKKTSKQNFNEQDQTELQKQKDYRKEKAAAKFSKQRFIKSSQNQPLKNYQPELPTIKTTLERIRNENLKLDIFQHLISMGIDFNDPIKNINWLNLSHYDDKTYETFSQIFDFKFENAENEPVTARCLVKIQDTYSYIKGIVSQYNVQKEKFKFSYQFGGKQKKILVPRIHICFDHQDPQKYCQRVKVAFISRIYADSLMKLNFYVDAMPTQHLSSISDEQKKRIFNLVHKIKRFSKEDLEELFEQTRKQYSKTMNQIIFKKYLVQMKEDIIPNGLILPPVIAQQQIQYYGLLPLQAKKGAKQIIIQSQAERQEVAPKSFLELFKEFCEKSLSTSKEVIISMQLIKSECDQIKDLELFKIDLSPRTNLKQVKKQPLRYEHFQTDQNVYIQKIINRIKVNWTVNIREIIQKEFKKGAVQWFNFNQQNKELYQQSKTQRYFKKLKFIMEDTLLFLSQKSFTNFCKYVKSFIPIKVEIKSANHVINYYEDGFILDSTKPETYQLVRSKLPLFQTDLMRSLDDSCFSLATQPQNFMTLILNFFDKMMEELCKVAEIQQKCMIQIFKKQRSQRYLKSSNRNNPDSQFDESRWLKDLYNNLKKDLQNAITPAVQYLKEFDPFLNVLRMKPQQYVKQIQKQDEQQPKQPQVLQQEILDLYKKQAELLKKMPDSIHVSFFRIHFKEVNEKLAAKYNTAAKGLEALIAKKAKKSSKNLFQKYDEIKAKIKVKPKDIQKLVQIREFMASVPIELERLARETQQSNKIYNLLDEFKYTLPQQDLKKKYQALLAPKEILEQIEKKKIDLEIKKIQFQENLKIQQEEFKATLQGLSRTISQFHMYNKKQQHHQISEKVQLINSTLSNCVNQSRKFNSRENLFEKQITDYSKVQQLTKDFSPYSNLWLTTNKWIQNIDKWMHSDWQSLDADYCQKFVEQAIKNINSANRYFKEKDIIHILKIGESVRNQIDQFRPKVPLMVALRKKGMTERHWKQISQKVGFNISPTDDFSFQTVLQLGLMKHVETCIQVGEKASKQFTIETNLNAMIKKWQDISFGFSQFKTSYIVKGFDDVMTILDEHIANTQAMQFSPFKKPFEQKILQWGNTLKRISDIIEEWIKLQLNWMYLQPIFDSPDIAKQLPNQSKKFKSVDNFWKIMINKSREVLNVQKICQFQEQLQKIRQNNNLLDVIQKQLNSYLQKKRQRFARFFFLSNNQLLEILSQTKQPTAVQPFLKKVFENINQVEFDNKGTKTILAMFSAERQKINFTRVVDPKGKNVQDWMTQVQQQMKLSVRAALLHSMLQYKKRKRENWVMQHPGQCVLNGSQIHWTHQVEDYIQMNKVKDYFNKLSIQLNQTVELVRTKLSKNQSVTLNALIVIDVHAKDVVENLYKNNVNDLNAFEWISQLRYYWENQQCQTKCVQTVFPYGYEYLGNTLRLVITPLTDKCYMTLMGALKLNLGGAPAGPAGTGKTQTTKDLAKALAKQCVVFNCSDSMDFIMVGKFFKGLASAGAWCCFDQFNRINIQVLSVIAQQLLILFGQKAKNSPRVDFEGSDIRLQPTFSVFITMNPGYAGRTQLPDNLKALFRAVAMMVPDYAMIGEILLYSFGFKKGRQLAKKMVVTFKLASQQLSSQDHYDYGMRAVRSVINAAGILKQKDQDMEQDQLLLRALRDVNVPKFLKDDLPLFQNIIKDLFPGVDKPIIDYGKLLISIKNNCEKRNLEAVDSFVTKIIQLYDTIQVRHGLMIVGPTGGGKTQNYNVLKNALSALQNQGYYKVNTKILNPKSITMGQLYGMFNDTTRQWIDGVLAYTVRECCKDRSSQKYWIMFDGPVDALWIQNMNTVLDDNKKLCLNSGQILTLTPHMTMMFEVQDLLVASPATVSRCGMVYMQPQALGVTPLLYKYQKTLPPKLIENKNFLSILRNLFSSFLHPLLQFLRKNCKQSVASTNQNLTQSLMKILNCYFNSYLQTEIKKITTQQTDAFINQNLEGIFLFSVIWSICATTDNIGRQKLNLFVRQLTLKNKLKIEFPTNGTIYDYLYNQKKKMYLNWNQLFANYQPDQKLQYHELIIPTADSQRNKYLTKMLLLNNFHVLHTGSTGTGKTLNIVSLLTQSMPDNYQYIAVTFSAQTSANQTQDSIDSKLQKLKRGVFGAPVGKKYVVFVDDFNMPKKQQFGAQPPLQILRQYLDHGGWYNRKDLQWMKIQGLIILSAMGPPGGGRSKISDRVVRQFNQIAYTQLDNKTISYMFTILTNNFLKRFSEDVKQMIPKIVESVLGLYIKIKNQLLPTPKKSHYTFNLRDISKVFQGICNASLKHGNSVDYITRLWYHQNMRVFSDRLIQDEDRIFIKNSLSQNFKRFGVEEKQVINVERLIFCDFYNGKDVEPRHYIQVPDMKEFIKKIYEMMDQYNNDTKFSGTGGRNKMRLVLFLDACEHISRISRILRQPLGNALLLGVGGSGRQSLAKIATFISNYSLFQIQVIKGYSMKSWREDIKKCLMQAGLENRQTAFIFVDTQIINQQMLQDLNSILNSGDVTGVYLDKDMEEIINTCKIDCLKKGLQPNKMNIYTQYLIRIKNNIHIVTAMSPLGDSFSTRLRMFPSLVNCCTLDWFTQWPEEALIAVGKGQLNTFLQNHSDQSLLEKINQIVQTFKTIHKSVESLSIDYKASLSRYNYVTPTSYLELLKIFQIILKQRTNQLKFSITRLKTGLNKLIQANTQVSDMQIMLKQLQPQLEKSAADTVELMTVLEKEKKQAEQTQKIVQQEQAQANKQAQQAMKIAKQVEQKVSEANARLIESLKAVQMLQTNHLVQVKSHKAPPKVAIIILGGCVIFFQDIIKQSGGEIVMKKIEGTLKKEEDWFSTARLYLLQNPKTFLQQLKKYDKQHINQALIAKFKQKILSDPDFTYEKAKNVGGPIQVLYLWAMAMYTFNDIYLKTQPLREQQAAVKQLVAQKNRMLAQKKRTLNEVINKIKMLEENFTECVYKKQTLTKNIQQCQIKLERAKKLTVGLSDQKERWAIQVQRLQSLQVYISGNSIISAGMISYAGAFTSQYRQRLLKIWLDKLSEVKIQYQNDTNLVTFLGKPIIIQQWNMAGLPKDDNSIQNGIIIDKSRRWPLMIDPQNQANKYIKNMGKQYHQQGIEVLKVTDHALMKTLQLSVQHGKWVLIENVGRQLDPSLQPILLQQFVKTSGGITITIGDKTLSYNDKFKFFMTTTQPNPHYSPQTFVKVTIINFAITPQGLQDQMLAQLVALQNPQLQQKKKEIVKRNAVDKKQLLNIEDSILQSLSQGNGGIAELLLDETLINQLQNSKRFASQINQRMKDSKITEQQIDKARQGYRTVAYRTSLLFFCIVDLAGIDPMYQYSLQWFINLFKMAVQNALPAKQLPIRLMNLINYFTYSLYQNVCRSLFQKHKLLFSFMLTVKIQFGKKQMDPTQWRYLLAGPIGDIKILTNPTKWIDENSWPDIFRQLKGMNQLPKFNGIFEHFMTRYDQFKPIFDSQKPQQQQLPSPWNSKLNSFQKLIILKAIRLDKVTPGIQSWISIKMGKQYIIPPTFDLGKCYKDSTVLTPLIFLLSPGSDPVADFIKFTKENQGGKKYQSISLGQGQGIKAEKMIKEASQRGGWVLLQNCHLAASWMPQLQRIVQDLDENIHKDFRLWLTSMPTSTFPISVLQNGVKMTIQPPQGLRANLLRSYANITEQQLNSCKKGMQFRKLLFGFCFFHAIIQDRRKFGPIGWNIPYQFTNQDLSVCKRQLKMLLDQYQSIPFKVLNYLGAQINYGGRVTDDKDVRLIKTILISYITQNAFKQDYKYSKSGFYYAPTVLQHSQFVSYIQALPLNPSPQVFGLHQNAQITTNQNQTLLLLESILSLQPKTSALDKNGNTQVETRQDFLMKLCSNLQQKTPQIFKLEEISQKYPTDYNQSMNTVLVQEIVRYNRLLEVVKSSLMNFKKAIKGILVMSQQLQKMGNSLYNNQVPKMWSDRGFLSLKPLASWLEDFIKRVQFLKNWVDNGTPKVFWISGLFFPQAFITGMLQNYARKHFIAIDKLSFDFVYMDQQSYIDIKQKPQNGCYVYGMYLEGCRWENKKHALAESRPKQLFSDLPMIHLIPKVDRQVPKGGIYNCPLYKVVSRAGTLSTTGHSTNFVMFLQLPTSQQQQVWIRAGVASFLALRY